MSNVQENARGPFCVWVGFDKDGEPKQVHPVKPHGDMVGFEWRQFSDSETSTKNVLYWMKKAEKAELIAEMLTAPESTKYVLRQYSTLDSVGRQKIDALMGALFAIKESVEK